MSMLQLAYARRGRRGRSCSCYYFIAGATFRGVESSPGQHGSRSLVSILVSRKRAPASSQRPVHGSSPASVQDEQFWLVLSFQLSLVGARRPRASFHGSRPSRPATHRSGLKSPRNCRAVASLSRAAAGAPAVWSATRNNGGGARRPTPHCSGLGVSRCAPSFSPLNSISLGSTSSRPMTQRSTSFCLMAGDMSAGTPRARHPLPSHARRLGALLVSLAACSSGLVPNPSLEHLVRCPPRGGNEPGASFSAPLLVCVASVNGVGYPSTHECAAFSLASQQRPRSICATASRKPEPARSSLGRTHPRHVTSRSRRGPVRRLAAS